MHPTRQLHHQAMEAYDLASVAKRRGDVRVAAEQFRIAYELESQAAHTYLDRHDLEPTRSILFRSAATLAKDCGLITEMRDLVQKGLSGNPPPTVVEELRDLLE